MVKLFLIGIALVALTGAGIAAEPGYDTEALNSQADRIEGDTRKSINKAVAPDEVHQIIGKAQMDYSRMLIRQNSEIIRQNSEMIRQNNELIRQNNEVIRLLRNQPRK